MSTLFEITNEFQALYEFATTAELGELDEQAYADTLNGLIGELEIKSSVPFQAD